MSDAGQSDSMDPLPGPGDRVAVVMSGAVARGAFQAGALGAILARQSRQPSIFLGTSAGAINAVLWVKAMRDLGLPAGATQVAEQVRDVWLSMPAEHVFEAPLSWSPTGMWRSVRRFWWPAVRGFFWGGPGVESLLDTAPLRDKARRIFGDQPLQLPSGVDAVGVVATWVPPASTGGSASGRSRLFLQERPGVWTADEQWKGDTERALDVRRCPLRKEHVLASCAVPAAFSAISVRGAAGGWYVDGGVRLNTPLQAAIALGATHVIVISAMALSYAPDGEGGVRPHVGDATSQVMHALLADRAVEDLLAVQKTNRLLQQAPDKTSLKSRDERVYRPVRVAVVAPRPGQLRALAERAWHDHYSGTDALLKLEPNAVLGRLLRTGGDGASYYELLSYLMFDQQYLQDSYQAGMAAVDELFERSPEQGHWRLSKLLGALPR